MHYPWLALPFEQDLTCFQKSNAKHGIIKKNYLVTFVKQVLTYHNNDAMMQKKKHSSQNK